MQFFCIFFALEHVWKIIEGREAFAEEGLHMLSLVVNV